MLVARAASDREELNAVDLSPSYSAVQEPKVEERLWVLCNREDRGAHPPEVLAWRDRAAQETRALALLG